MSAVTTGAGLEAAATVMQRVLAELDVLVPRMGETYRDEIPEYAAMPAELMEGEVLVTSRRIVEEFFAQLRAGSSEPARDVLRHVAGAGRRRLDMGVPLEAGLHAFRVAGRVVWDAVVAATRPGEERALAFLAGSWIEYVDRVSTAFAEGYVEASHDRLRRIDTRRRAIVDALLAATTPADATAVASEYSLALAPAFTPVVVDGADVATRIDALIALAPRDTLAGFRGDRVLLLVPGELTTSTLRALTQAGPVVVGWSTPAAAGDGLLDRVRHASELLDAAALAGRERGAFGPDDLVLEHLLTRDERGTAALSRLVLEPLADADRDGVFRSTLRTYLATGSIPDTAEREVCHANTVAYRLKRVRDVTGLDARVPAEAALLVLAMLLEGEDS